MIKKMDKKAFTLIELIVVIAVVGILVLLGIPRFTGHKERAELARIQYDIKVMEQEIGTAFINNDDDFDNWENNNKDFNQLIQEGKLFEKEGIAKEVESTDETYKVIPEKYKDKINTKLKGTFYANSGGKVYYEHTKPLGGIPTEPEEEPGYSDEEIQDLIDDWYIPIATANELNNVRNNTTRIYGEGTKWEGLYTGGLNKKYIQVTNIDLSGYSEEGWSPIGTYVRNNTNARFRGIYDGGNYVITNLEVKGEGKNYQGLFGFTSGAAIRNVALEDININGHGNVGGLVGEASSSAITNSYATGSVIGTGDDVGGLVGEAGNSTIENSYATGSVTDGDYIGGLVGYAYGTTIRYSYATGSVTSLGAGGRAGGLVGFAGTASTISNSYSTGSVTGSGERVGGLVGLTQNDTTISNSYATGSVKGKNSVGGLVGLAEDSTATNSYWNKETTGLTSSAGQDGSFGKTTEEMKQQTTYSDWSFGEIWEIQEGVSYPTLINNPERH